MATADQQKDLVLPPGRTVVVQNDKGLLDVWVGPTRVVSSSSNEVALAWNHQTKVFDRFDTDPTRAVRNQIQVAKDEYVILEGLPTSLKAGDPEHPPVGQTRSAEINVSERTTLHGPRVFALWPRQYATVIPGHRLAYDQYLVVRVYDDRQAKATPDHALEEIGVKTDELTMGDLFIIDGTRTSFYMPGPGIEVVKDDETNTYVRSAVTVEPLEYAYLRDLNGEKEYVRGPAVVFPKPTQTVVTRTLPDGTVIRRFRALELTETSAIYVKVTRAYVEEHGPDKGKKREVGEELFLRGKDFPLYYPRVEHMLVRQGESEIHFAIAIPQGQGYYVRNKRTWTDEADNTHVDGDVELVKGPKTLLIDPRNQTLTKRALPLDLASLMYPGNQEVQTINQQRLRENAERAGIGVVSTPEAALLSTDMARGPLAVRKMSVGRSFEGDISNRPNTYTKPHAIDLGSSKYDGSPRMAIDPGYAVLLIDSVGRRRVVKDGEVALLAYDEYPRVLRFSTGTPKSGHARRSDVYLRTTTKISDQIELDTADGVKLTVKVSYRVRFEGDPTKWFDIEDPVGFLADNLRSIIHHGVSKKGIREFHADFASILRTIVLGEPKDGTRPGRTFTENGMHIYDVDVLTLTFADRALEAMFTAAATAMFKNELQVSAEMRNLGLAKELADIGLSKAALAAAGAEGVAAFSKRKADADATAAIAEVLAEAQIQSERDRTNRISLEADREIILARVANDQLQEDTRFANTKRANDEKIRLRNAKTDARVRTFAAIQPQLVEAMERLADTEIVNTIAGHFNVQAILTGASPKTLLGRVLGDTRLARVLGSGTNSTNGARNGHADD